MSYLISVAFLLFPALMTGQSAARKPGTANQPPVIRSIEVPPGTIDLCPWTPSGTCSRVGLIIPVSVAAHDSDGDRLRYDYSVTGGRIKGRGPNVLWDFTRVPPGTYSVTVKVRDKHGASLSKSTTMKVELCDTCDPPSPRIGVVCFEGVREGERATFDLEMSGDKYFFRGLKYQWSLSAGTIRKGQRRSKIEVDTIGLVGQRIIATVEIAGLPPEVDRTASCTTEVLPKN